MTSVIYYFYFFLLSVISVFYLKDIDENKKDSSGVLIFKVLLCLLISVVILFMYSQIEFRYGTDIEAYSIRFKDSLWLDFSLPDKEIFFYIYTWFFSKISDSFSLYLLSLRAVSILILAYCFYKIERKCFLLIFILFTLSPFFFSSFSNVIRQGIAMSIGLLAITQFVDFNGSRSNIFGIILVFCAYNFHSVSIIYVLIFPLFYFERLLSIKNLMLIWMIVLVLSYFNINENIAKFFIPLDFSYYSYVAGLDVDYNAGFRFDFLFLTLLPVFFHFVLCKELPRKYIFRVYVSFVIIYQFLSFIHFSDRVLLFAWFLMPLLVVISLKEGKVKYFHKGIFLCTIVLTFLYINFHSFYLTSDIFK